MSDFLKNKNYDNVYFRDLYSSVCYFLFDILEITRVVEGKKEKVKIPILPSATGDENFIKEFLTDYKKICGDISPNVIINQVPSGRIIGDGGININSDDISSNGIRTRKLVDISNEFFDEKEEVYGRRSIVGISLSLSIEFKASSMIERFKMIESIINNFYRERSFTFTSNGIMKIPVNMTLSDSFKLESQKQFKFSEYDNSYQFDTSFDISSYLIIDDNYDVMKSNNKVYKLTGNVIPDTGEEP